MTTGKLLHSALLTSVVCSAALLSAYNRIVVGVERQLVRRGTRADHRCDCCCLCHSIRALQRQHPTQTAFTSSVSTKNFNFAGHFEFDRQLTTNDTMPLPQPEKGTGTTIVISHRSYKQAHSLLNTHLHTPLH
jgi:hypothetical protein